MCVWLSFQTKEALFAALRLTFYVIYKRILRSIAIFRSISDSTRVIASDETDGGQGGRPPPLAGHFEVFGPPVTALLILLSDL